MASLKELIFKPRWQHRSADVRERAVALDDDPRLVAALPEIAREDPEATVRLAALRRLDDLLPLMRAASDDEAPEVREAAFRIYRAMLSGEHDSAPPLDERLEIVPRLDDDGLIEYLAGHGHDEPIREAALARIDRAGLLGDLALTEPSRALRSRIIERIDQPATLERIAEQFRTSDKRSHRAALERLRQLGGQSEAAAEANAVDLCEELEQLSRSGAPRERKAEELERLSGLWESLTGEGRERHQRRFEGGRKILERLLSPEPVESPAHKALVLEVDGALADAAPLDAEASLASVHGVLERLAALRGPVATEGEQETLARIEAEVTRLEQLQSEILEKQPVDPRLGRLCDELDGLRKDQLSERRLGKLQERWDAAWQGRKATVHDDAVAHRFRSTMARLEAAAEQHAEARAKALAKIDGLMDALESALAGGSLADSVRAKQRVLDTLSTIGRDPKVDAVEFKGRVAAARGKLRELRDWQHWANNKVRTSLCEEAESLIGSALHPDALSAKIKALRAGWKELDDGERLPGDAPNRRPAAGLYRRFQAACNKAFTPAKGFFEKRAEYREQHLEDLEKLAGELEAAVADESLKEVRPLEQLIRRGRRSMRELHEIPPKARSAMARRLREGANTLDARLDELYAVVERRKQRIIDEVAALDPEADLDGAIATAKDAQQRWQAAGHARRKREQALWKEFRSACDRIFEHVGKRNEAERAAEQAQLDQLDALIGALEACMEGAAADPEGSTAVLHRIMGDWRAIGANQRSRERRFQQVKMAVEQEIAKGRARRESERRDAELALLALCQEAEARWFGGDDGDLAALEARAPADLESLPATLRDRWEQARGDAPSDLDARVDAAREAAAEICIALEFLAGVESPEDQRQARMDYQVARLSARMSGEAVPPARDEAADLIDRWSACGPLPAASCAGFQQRVDRALAEIDALGGG